ncbi:MarR family winged helix-turn-helix transcriptional regulator [Actimicrobium sp. CCC2.4]|uniref:MarR family winged helix-turn-helix transcriptional regulator n=1 Tax=Actimicrobium sp. CCC2.4 TaxID=3048606 RepID=UPI002AC90160|nr:MarR family winged helix-turn-helix transcriptional regulator [Actimicrobium sp. CCC2.4]MEB0135260.1 MarR family winged helix-turn-helix transcriptional regulator [Actimicrobium sp. CCC2.4]WPX31052.1 MarR family winged helix-turn-helix transcriptional regulator [Actimicrobium sp. CCC2.4]
MTLLSAPGCTCFALRRLTRTVSRLYDLHMAGVGLKTTQFSLLKHVAAGSQPMAQLALHLSTDRTTLTRNLKPLLEAGWVTLTPGADARQRIVTLTESGQAKVIGAKLAWQAAQLELERTLGPELIHALHGDTASAMQLLTPLLEEKSHANHA